VAAPGGVYDTLVIFQIFLLTCADEMRAAGNHCSCPTPCETSNYVPTASFSIVMGPETTAVLDDSATALRQRLFRARETTYRIDGDKWAGTLRRFHAASRAMVRGARHAETSATTINDGYDTVDEHATQVLADFDFDFSKLIARDNLPLRTTPRTNPWKQH